MFKSKESVGHMIGGAVIGVAVGMLIERIRSPRPEQQPESNEETPRLICCENVKKPSNNLQVPSHRCKDRINHHRRSRSVCRSKNAEKPCHLSVSAALQQDTKTSISESDLRSRSAEKRYSSQKLEIDAKSREDCLDKSTKYLRRNHDRRSRSACKSKNAEKPCYLSVSAALQENTKTRISKSDLRSRSADNRYSCRKLDINARSREDFLDKSTEYLPFGSKVRKNLRDKTDEACVTTSTEYLPVEVKNEQVLFASDVNDRKADFTAPAMSHGSVKTQCDAEEKVFNSESYRESVGCGSTEYLKPCEPKNYSEYAKPTSVSHIAGRESSAMQPECPSTSIGSLSDTEVANCSINATYDTLDKEMDFDSYRENHTESAEKLEGFDSKEFVTLPTFDDFGNSGNSVIPDSI